MIVSETIPTILAWAELKTHINLDDDTQKAEVEAFALAAVEAFELETGVAAGSRTITVTYTGNETHTADFRLPKGPVISITSVVGDNNNTVSSDDYELRQIGKQYYLHLWRVPPNPIVITYVAGYSTVPQLIKSGCLLHTEHLFRKRGATTSVASQVVEFGLERIYNNYNARKAIIG